MTTTTPTTALAELDTLTRYGWSEAYIGEESQLIEDPSGTYVRFEDVQALARRAAQPNSPEFGGIAAHPVAPVQDVLSAWKVLADDDKPDTSRRLDVILANGVTLESHSYSQIDWTQVSNWRYSTPSPQIAEVAELPKPWAQRFNEGEFTSVALAKDAEIAELRAAIAASRRAAGGDPKLLGQVVMYPNYSTVIKWVEGVTPPPGTKLYAIPDATPAPASAGQAAPAMPDGWKVERNGECMRLTDLDGRMTNFSPMGGPSGKLAYEFLSAVLAARPAEGASQAGRQYQRKVDEKIIARRDAEIASLRAGQAGQVAMPEQVRNYLMGQDLYLLLTNAQNGIDSPATMQSANRLLVRLDKLRELIAAQPAEGAGQAGQVAVARVTGSDTVIGRESRRLEWVKGAKPFEFEPGTVLYAITERAAAPAELTVARLEKFIDWYLRGGKRMEIDPHGHIRVTTREHIINWLDGGSNEGSR